MHKAAFSTLTLAAFACSSGFVGTVLADVFDEGALGDFPGTSFFNTSNALDIGVLGAGSHTITGSITGNSVQDPSDTLLFQIEPGFEITTLTASFTNVTFGGGSSSVFARLYSTTPSFDLADEAELRANNPFEQFDAAPHGPDTYYMFVDMDGFIPGTAMDYQLDLRITPAPGSAGLCALVALGAARRRR